MNVVHDRFLLIENKCYQSVQKNSFYETIGSKSVTFCQFVSTIFKSKRSTKNDYFCSFHWIAIISGNQLVTSWLLNYSSKTIASQMALNGVAKMFQKLPVVFSLIKVHQTTLTSTQRQLSALVKMYLQNNHRFQLAKNYLKQVILLFLNYLNEYFYI